MSDDEKKYLEQVIDAHPAKLHKLKLTIGNWTLTWCFFMLLLIVGWLIVSWVVRKALDIEIGWDNDVAAFREWTHYQAPLSLATGCVSHVRRYRAC